MQSKSNLEYSFSTIENITELTPPYPNPPHEICSIFFFIYPPYFYLYLLISIISPNMLFHFSGLNFSNPEAGKNVISPKYKLPSIS